MLCSDKMPSLALTKLRSAGSAVLSSLPQRSAGFGKIVSYGGSGAHSRSTSAGSSLSDGRSSHGQPRSRAASTMQAYAEKSPMGEDSLFAIDMFGPPRQESSLPSTKALPLDSNPGFSLPLPPQERHEERGKNLTLKECAAKPGPVSSIGLPPGLEDVLEPKNAAVADTSSLEEKISRVIMQQQTVSKKTAAADKILAEASDALPPPEFFLDYGAFDFEAPQYWTSPVQESLDGSMNGSAATLNANAPLFSPGEQVFDCVGHLFNVNAQPFDVDAQQFDVNAQPFDGSWHSEDDWQLDENGQFVEAFDADGQSFQISDLSFDASPEAFEADVEWFQPQATWDTTLLSTNPADAYSGARAWDA